MESNTFEIEGLDEVLKALDELPDVVQNRIIKSVLQKAGRKFIVSELRSALSYSHRLKKALRVVNVKSDRYAVKAGVIIDRRVNNEIPAGVLIRFLDGGTVQRKTKKGYNRGAVKGRNEVVPVIERSIQPMVDYVMEEFANEINSNLDKRLKKLNK